LVQTSYTYTNSDEPSGVRALRIPDHSFTLRANQTLWQRLDVATDILATSSYTYPLFTGSGSRDFVFKGPLRADVAVHYTIPLRERLTARLYTRIENITNRRRYEDGFPAPRAWAVAGVKLIF
ncbi:MAG TPA: hypothetical protein VE621_18475, partial [Bryobacteraceae bacterium]|nr:hypothetical protein [Bryobacteraceae bacterium]